jgi:phage shock protein A
MRTSMSRGDAGAPLSATVNAASSRVTNVQNCMDGGREDLARKAAQAIANLEADRDAAMTARTLFAAEITRLKRHVANAEARITELGRGRRIARASEAVRTLRRGGIEAARPYECTLPEAENTLRRLRERQIEAQAAAEALIELDAASGPLATAENLAEQGFGPRLRSTAADVLARLNARRKQPA